MPQTRRAELVARFERLADPIDSTTCGRHTEILRRHILGGESERAVRTALGISEEAFKAERRAILQRAAALVEAESAIVPAYSVVVERRVPMLLAQAQSLYGLGFSEQALDVLHDVSSGVMEARERLDVVVLTIDALRDVERLDRLPRLADRARAWLADATANSLDRRIAAIAADWTRAWLCYQRGNSTGFAKAWHGTLDALRDLSSQGDRTAVRTLCGCWSAVASQMGTVGWSEAENGLREAAELARRFQLPRVIEARLHADRAFVYQQDPTATVLAYSELEVAYALAIEHAAPRAVWRCLAVDIGLSTYCEDKLRALESASMLFEGVRTCESVEWKRVAACHLINAYLALDRFEEAERVTTLDGEYASPLETTFGRCNVLLKQGHYVESRMLANELLGQLAHPSLAQLRANALLFRAQAASALGDLIQARRDIEEAIDIYESCRAQLLSILRTVYRTAFAITGKNVYEERVRELTPSLGAAQPARLSGRGIGLTPRQAEIAWLAAEGATNREIAQRLGLSYRTVGNHLEAVFTYFGLSGIHARRQLAEVLQTPASGTRR